MSTLDHDQPAANHTGPIRVALVITGLSVGGAEKCLTQLALHVKRERFQLEIYSLQPRPTGEQAMYVNQLETSGHKLHFLNARSVLSFPRVLFQLWWHFRRQKPHVVQTFLYHANILGTLAARLAGVRFIYVGIRVLETKRWRMLLERWLYPLAKHEVYVSKSLRRAYRFRRWDFQPFVIPNAVDVSEYRDALPSDLSEILPAKDTPILLVIGRLHLQKGIGWLLCCLPQVFDNYPHHCVIVGEGADRKNLEFIANAYGIEHRVHFLGWRADVPSLIQRADLLVLPSLYEGMPNVVLESMAAGKTIIATRVEGVAELLGPHAKELTVAFGDAAAMIALINSHLSDGEACRTIGQQLQTRASEKFSIEIMTACYEALWEEAVSWFAKKYG
jgi:glycosyltransferase involved in cell wall biosynthesis